ncbi:hypothetical protein Naga_103347g1 [Nannochloropsis gaditana]|uniref:Uncharacterized protein n=1 Tax=Nannochloropsis gaditana TaxID=72520 RepID=W7TFY4_9STRA|nr:hypothetical protein Naga_103347g1 [Nannochloropsis gaditana]
MSYHHTRRRMPRATSRLRTGAFKALTDKYELRGETQKALLMSEFSHLKFDENGDPSETFEAAEELARKMKSRFDMEINDSILLTHLINKIPSAYGMVKQ